MRKVFASILALFCLTTAVAQSTSTMGTDFWVSFLQNYNYTSYTNAPTLSLIITGKDNCSGTISNPLQNWSTDFTVTTGQITNVNIPPQYAYNTIGNTVENTGLHVTATDTISLFASKFYNYTFDVALVYPTHALMDEYLIQTYETIISGNVGAGLFVVIGTEDDTQVEIKPSAHCGTHPANTPFTITLNRGECYMVKADSLRQLSGSTVKAMDCKKVNVLQGTTSSQIPLNYGYVDHTFEQCVPTTYWGKNFIVTASKSRTKDRVKVTSLRDNCSVKIDGSVVATLASGQTHEFEILNSDPAKFIETSEPACVYIYLTGAAYGGTNGDPSMALINPIEQQVDYITFGTFKTATSNSHFVNIVGETDKISGITLDGNNISDQFAVVPGNNDYSFARVQIEYGSHTLQNNEGGFVAHVYGLGYTESYAYSVGSAAAPLDKQITIEDQIIDLDSNIELCAEGNLHFNVATNFEFNSLNWDFGDGTTGSGTNFTHTYHNAGTYLLSAYIQRQFDNCLGTLTDTVQTYVTVNPANEITLNEDICSGESIIVLGQEYSTTGNYTINTQNQFGCDSTIHLNITANHVYTNTIPHTTCDSYTWKDETYTQSGLYQFDTVSLNGCDSIVYLDLTVNHADSSHLFNPEPACDSYSWKGTTYTQSGFYQFDTLTIHGCDSIMYLNLTVNHADSSHVTTPEPVCDFYTWKGTTYTQSGFYQFDTLTVNGCDSIMHLDLTVNHADSSYLFTPESVCDSYTWKNVTYTQSGIYQYDTLTSLGCDSIMYLDLTIHHTDSSYLLTPEPTCDSYNWKGTTYTQSGFYQFDTLTVHGCDSIMYLNLTVNHADSSYLLERTVCDFFPWKGEIYTESGLYRFDTLTIHGCDSVMYLNLTINSADSTYLLEKTVCDSYTWSGATYTQSGYYHFDTITDLGCDSIMYLDLTVNHSDSTYLLTPEPACNSYFWKGTNYTQSGLYQVDTLTIHGCDSVMFLNLTVNYSDSTYLFTPEPVCDSYIWKGETYTQSGIYHYDTLTTSGCDSIMYLDLTINYSDSSYILEKTACDSYIWKGINYTLSGYYQFDTITVLGCDSIMYLDLTLNYSDSSYVLVPEPICDSYIWKGTTYTQSGYYRFDTLTVHGCDSVMFLDLTVNYSDSTYMLTPEPACDSYTWKGTTYTQSGIYHYDTLTALGCDSIMYLDLTVYHSDHTGSETVSACDVYEWKGSEYAVSGDYTFDTLTTHGCDSTVTLHLTVNYSDLTGSMTETTCDNFLWNGTTYTESGDYTFDTQTVSGCDSTTTLHLTVNYSDHSGSIVETACDNYSWKNNIYTQSGDYPFDTLTTLGCDSTVTLHLTVNYSEFPSFTEYVCDNYNWHGQDYGTTGTYTFDTLTEHGCQRTETLNLTVAQTPDITINGTHWPIGGSETQFNTHHYSIETLNSATEFDSVTWNIDCPNWYITLGTSDTDIDLHIHTWVPDSIALTATAYNECGNYTYTFWIYTSYYNIGENDESHISIAPNPNKGIMDISLDNTEGPTDIKVFDINGKIVDCFVINEGTKVYHYEIPVKAVGVYSFVISSRDKKVVKRIVKQ